MTDVIKEYPYLDKGYVRLLSVGGNDELICKAARTSYGEDEYESYDENNRLISYLYEHRHTSPFEMPNITLQIKLPIFVMRQLVRHRTARLNEASARYKEMCKDFWVPPITRLGGISKTHKQGTGALLPQGTREGCLEIIRTSSERSLRAYELLIDAGLSLEVARVVIPVNFYTTTVWQIDLNNGLKLLALRSHKGAQEEIQQFAAIVEDIIKDNFPMVYDAYIKHNKKAAQLSGEEIEIIAMYITACAKSATNFNDFIMGISSISKRKKIDLIEKFNKNQEKT
jgi:thymidylate synthase (FAD)